MVDEDSNAISPPYISFRTFLNLLDRLAESGIPQQIDRSYWAPFLSGSVGPQVIAALRFFALIIGTDNEPTPDLERLVEDKEHRKQIFGEMLRKYYASVFTDVDLARTTTGILEKAFSKHYKLSAETRRKSITFFLHAAQYAEFPLSIHLKDASRTRNATAKSSSRIGVKKFQQTNSDSGNHQQAIEPKLLVRNEPKHPATHNVKQMAFPDGEILMLSYSGAVFAMDKQHREFLFSLIDLMSSYEQKIAKDGASNEEALKQEEGEEMSP